MPQVKIVDSDNLLWYLVKLPRAQWASAWRDLTLFSWTIFWTVNSSSQHRQGSKLLKTLRKGGLGRFHAKPETGFAWNLVLRKDPLVNDPPGVFEKYYLLRCRTKSLEWPSRSACWGSYAHVCGFRYEKLLLSGKRTEKKGASLFAPSFATASGMILSTCSRATGVMPSS